jgi:Leucine-rich repeat (LRR) protein
MTLGKNSSWLEALNNLKNVTELGIGSIGLSSVPSTLQLPSIRILDLSSNGIATFPEVLGNFTTLERVDLK